MRLLMGHLVAPALLSFVANGCSKDSPKPGLGAEEKKTQPSDGSEKNKSPTVIRPVFSLDSGLEFGGTLAVSSDGTILVAQGVGKVKNVQIWDLRKKTTLHQFDVPAAAYTQLALSPDHKTVAYSVEEEFLGPGLVLLRDVATGKELHELRKRPVPILVPNLVFS